MKSIKAITGIIFTAVVILGTVSCKKEFYTKANVNPNAPGNVPPGTLLTPIEVNLGYTQGGDMARFASMFVQQSEGVSRQAAAYYEYIFTNQDPEDMWDNMYTSVMENDYTLINQSTAAGNYEYKGIGEALMAYCLQISVDCWGSEPYSQAFLGATQLHPSYDNDAALYNTAVQLCNQAIADLSNTNPGTAIPSSDDVIYGGDATRWIKFAHAIKARLFIHQSQTNGGNAAMADSALLETSESFSSNADNAQVTYGTAATANNPWYQFYTQRGDISFAFNTTYTGPSYFWALLTSLNDPRKTILVDSVNESVFNYLNSYYQLATSPVEFICYDELQFIAAEATLRSGGTSAAAQVFYQNAITANMQKLSSNPSVGTISPAQITTYITANGTLTPVLDTALKQVALQEYIALYLNPEAWVLWRRTTVPSFQIAGAAGSPALTPVAGPFQSNGIPRRMLYPQSEINLNTSMPAYARSATLWSPRIFWDN